MNQKAQCLLDVFSFVLVAITAKGNQELIRVIVGLNARKVRQVVYLYLLAIIVTSLTGESVTLENFQSLPLPSRITRFIFQWE